MTISKPLFIVAEDDPDDHLLIQDAIEDACPAEIETQFVWDGVELIDFLQTQKGGSHVPILIVLDLNMPRKDGRMALREIKANPALAEIPVAILTTSNNSADAEYCWQYGVVGYFRKPGSMTELREIMGYLCTTFLLE